MRLKKYPSLERAAEALKNQGFTERFLLGKNCLKNQSSGQLYDPAEVTIVEYHRFIPKNLDCVTIVVALESLDETRGLLITTYNAYEKVKLLEFMDQVRIKSRMSKAVKNII